MKQTDLRRRLCAFLLSLGLVGLAPSTTLAAGVSPAKATPVQREQAQSRFLKGRGLYKSKKYEAALAQLNASLDIVASPNTRLYIGRCLRDMGKTVAAYVELGRVAVEARELVHEDARYEQAATAALAERAQLEPKLAFVEVAVTHAGPETTLRVSGDEVRRGGWAEPVPVLPGSVEILVETPGHAPVVRTLALRGGDRKQAAIDADAVAIAADASHEAPPLRVVTVDTAKSDSSAHTVLRPFAFATAGVAVAGLTTFLVAGAMSNSTYSRLEKACGSGPCPPGHEGDISTGRSEKTLANVGLGVFAAFAATSVTLFILSPPNKSSAAASTSTRIVAGPSFVAVKGAF